MNINKLVPKGTPKHLRKILSVINSLGKHFSNPLYNSSDYDVRVKIEKKRVHTTITRLREAYPMFEFEWKKNDGYSIIVLNTQSKAPAEEVLFDIESWKNLIIKRNMEKCK